MKEEGAENPLLGLVTWRSVKTSARCFGADERWAGVSSSEKGRRIRGAGGYRQLFSGIWLYVGAERRAEGRRKVQERLSVKLGANTLCEHAHGNDPVGMVTVPLVIDDPVSCLVTHLPYGERSMLVGRA